MHIPDNTRLGIVKYLGEATDAFLTRADKRLEKYTNVWQLSGLSFMPTNTVNLLFSCVSAFHGDCVLKMCIPGPEVATEINCLQSYGERGYCKLWKYDLADDILLLERIIPGDQLWAVTDYCERAKRMAMTVKGLHLPYQGKAQYPTYLSWMEEVRSKLIQKRNMDEILFYLEEAIRIYTELKNVTAEPACCTAICTMKICC